MEEQASLLKDARAELVESLTQIENAMQHGDSPPADEVEQALGNIGVVIEVLDD